MNKAAPLRKIIHIDMDAFYASVEARDNPSLKNKPFAVGGTEKQRGVLCTSNYLARSYGVYAAMSSTIAKIQCPELIIVPPRFMLYRSISKKIHAIFRQYTHKVEPISLDEAYLDVTDSNQFQGSATLIAQSIQQQIFHAEKLTASAGISYNKLLAKIASDWEKPQGCFTIPPEKTACFIENLPIRKLPGVGKVVEKKLHDLGIHLCCDLKKIPEDILAQHFGKMGERLFSFCRGIDNREVCATQERKSISVEETFKKDITQQQIMIDELTQLHKRLLARAAHLDHKRIHKIFVKIKFSNFVHTTIETTKNELCFTSLVNLLKEGLYREQNLPVRLLGIGVRFSTAQLTADKQLELENFSYNEPLNF